MEKILDGEKTWWALSMRQSSVRECVNLLMTSANNDTSFFNPTRHVLEYHNGTFNLKRRPLYPGYVFVRCGKKALSDMGSNRPDGFYGPVHFGETIVPVRNEEIDRIKELGDDSGNVGVSYGVLKNGSVKITSGPLKGREGYVVRLSKRKHRVSILIPMGGKKVKLEVACIINSEDNCAATIDNSHE